MKRGFVIHHNGPAANCVGQPHSRCERFWNAVRSYHVNTKGWSDIAYSFGVCPHGVRFTGRGWFKNQFANGSDVVGANDGKDSEWYTVLVFLGADEKPTAEMVDGVKALIVEGRDTERCGQRVLPHNAFKVKACPGPEFTALAAVWDNNPTLGARVDTAPVAEEEEEDMRTKDRFICASKGAYWLVDMNLRRADHITGPSDLAPLKKLYDDIGVVSGSTLDKILEEKK